MQATIDYSAYEKEFVTLNDTQQEEVLMRAFEAVPGCLDATKAVYVYITAECDKGSKEFSVPAMLIPAMLGMSYNTRDSQSDFIRHYLKKHGKEEEDFTMMKKSDISFPGNVSTLEYLVPGKESESVIISKSAGNRAKWPFVTPQFARILLMRSNATIGRQLSEFYLAVHDAARSFLVRVAKISRMQALRSEKRDRSASSTYHLMNKKLKRTKGDGLVKVSNKYLGPRLNDMSNKFLTNHTKRELASALKKNRDATNVRDLMTPLQLSVCDTLNILLAEQIDNKPRMLRSTQVLNLHKNNIADLSTVGPLLHMLHSHDVTKQHRLTPETARRNLSLIENGNVEVVDE